MCVYVGSLCFYLHVLLYLGPVFVLRLGALLTTTTSTTATATAAAAAIHGNTDSTGWYNTIDITSVLCQLLQLIVCRVLLSKFADTGFRQQDHHHHLQQDY